MRSLQASSHVFRVAGLLAIATLTTSIGWTDPNAGASARSRLPAGLAQAVAAALGSAAPSASSQFAQQQELTASDRAPNDNFGYSVALSNDGHIALIGARFKNGFQGAAYIFTLNGNTYTQQQELTASNGAPGDLFGFSVALDNGGHIALIGAVCKYVACQGAAYVFTEQGNTWTQQQELAASDVAPGDNFGFSVALDSGGHIALIGARTKNGNTGAAYIFTEHANTWSQQQELTPPDGISGDNFSYSVTLDNDGHTALIGSPQLSNGLAGKAYVFTEQGKTWTEQQELAASDGAPGDLFGWSVALDNDGHMALIGAASKNARQGAAYVFTEHGNTWTQQQELTASDPGSENVFGFSVALDGDGQIAFIGARGDGPQTGAAYVFTAKH
jgi:hypothetical protein